MSDTIERHTIAVIVDNEPGVLARVIGLFAGRGYNISSLTVAAINDDESQSRINVVTSGTPMIIEQIKAQLSRLVPIHDVHDLTAEGPHLERELALVKIVNQGAERREALAHRRHLRRPGQRHHHRILRLFADRDTGKARQLHRPHARAGHHRAGPLRRGGDCQGAEGDLTKFGD